MTHSTCYFIIDFDSTFVSVEALDELANLSMAHRKDKDQLLENIRLITEMGMNGEISITSSLQKRLDSMNIHKLFLSSLTEHLHKRVSESFKRNKAFLEQNRDFIYIVSNGFNEYILPVVTRYGIKPDHVFGNSFCYDARGFINGFDLDNPLSKPQGKVKLVKRLNLRGNVVVIGDGYTDYEIFEAGLAKRFFAYTENVVRVNVVSKSLHSARTLDDVIQNIASDKDLSCSPPSVSNGFVKNLKRFLKQKLKKLTIVQVLI